MPDSKLVRLQTTRIEIKDLDARNLADSIREDLNTADGLIHAACTKLNLALRRQDWSKLGYADSVTYIQHEFGISPAWGFALARVAEMKQQFPELAPRLDAMNISKATTVAAAFPQDRKTRAFQADAQSVKGLVEIAERSTSRALRETVRESNLDGNPPHMNAPIYAYCPHCGGKLQLSRAAEITEAK